MKEDFITLRPTYIILKSLFIHVLFEAKMFYQSAVTLYNSDMNMSFYTVSSALTSGLGPHGEVGEHDLRGQLHRVSRSQT